MSPHQRRGITPAGRETLAAAVSADRDWGLPHSAVDRLVETLNGLTDADLEAAQLLAGHLDDAIAYLLIRRDMQRDQQQREKGDNP